ncbi:TolC family protein [Chitinophaga sp. G-6-1-13]|uniref:TolC family protein n=1 Tax=Chitinophaga fulva TaxID=2728842 RepID=A0A848GHM2_9BACT|nr:TolC family protein [Chitinophaga fulva]NML37317.1 TolC family protein [Chitinophaga fulva]
MKDIYKWWVLPIMTVFLVSCKITQKYQRPDMQVNGLYRDRLDTDTSSIGVMPWDTFFTDSLLRQLIIKGIDQNLDLKKGIERIRASRAAFIQSKAAFLPDVAGSAGVSRSRLSYPKGFGIITSTTQYDVGINASWEADIWNKLGSAKRTAFAQLLKEEAARKVVQTQIVADIAGNYYLLLALDQQLDVLEKTVLNRKEDARAMKVLRESNVVNGAAVVQSEANQYAAEVEVPKLKRQIRAAENAINVLLADPPGIVRRSSLAEQQINTASLQIGVPAMLLKNRPDVQQAEYAFRAAFENTNIARTYFYPSFNITGAIGFSSYSFKEWFSAAGFFANIAAGLAQPILNKGQNKARLEIARSRQQESLLNYQQSLIIAGQEVSDALYDYHTAADQQIIRYKQLKALEKSVDFTKKLLRYSTTTNYTDVLTSEQNLLSAQLDNINDRLSEWRALINLYRALGGGWQ